MYYNGTDKRYNQFSMFLKNKFGYKVYKITLDAGFSCPNRDGTLSYDGCIFCDEKGSFSNSHSNKLSLKEQVLEEIEIQRKRFKAEKFMSYFQAFTNTYAPVERLRKLFTEAIRHPDIVILSVATRPDCLPPEVIDLLAELNRIKPVWVELGLQTIHEETARQIRRGYELPVYEKAVADLKEEGIYTITHVILGLPGETREQMLETAAYVGKSGVQGIKLQLLHVLEGTDLAEEYRRGEFDTLSMEEYVSIVRESAALLPEDVAIHRLTGDGNRRTLIAPLWSLDKKRVLNALRDALQ